MNPSSEPARAIIVTCLVLVDSNDHLLATQRPEGKHLGGLWEFPGGKVEADEGHEGALRRELREELRLEVGTLSPLTPVTHAYDFARITLVPFLCRCASRPTVHLVEHAASCWITLTASRTLAWAPADLPVLDELERIL